MSGALQHIDHLYVDWTRWRNKIGGGRKAICGFCPKFNIFLQLCWRCCPKAESSCLVPSNYWISSPLVAIFSIGWIMWFYCSAHQGWMDKHHFGGSALWSNDHPQHDCQGPWTWAYNWGSFSKTYLIIQNLFKNNLIIQNLFKNYLIIHNLFKNYLIIHNLLARWVLCQMNLICITTDPFLNARNKLDL